MSTDLQRRPVNLSGYAWAVAAAAAATAVGWPLYHGFRLPDEARRPLLANTNVLMFYLVGVLWVATRHGRGPAVVASLLGVAAFDFCFVPPYLRLAVHDQQYVVTFGVMLATALVISTLTDRARRQSAAARRAEARAQAESVRNTLLSGVSHELRTPLAAITGAASALAETGDAVPPAARGEMLAMISAEAERLERLVNNLLDMTRLESGGLALKREWQPLQEVVGSALHHLDRRLARRRVDVDVPADLPLVHVDAAALEQVLINLLENAIQYTPAGSELSVTAQAAGPRLLVAVSDRGPGLPPGTEDRVFEKFFRGGPAGAGGGVGLGLAIARGIVEAHGGEIRALRRAGGGATFEFSLPLSEAPPAVDREPDDTAPAVGAPQVTPDATC